MPAGPITVVGGQILRIIFGAWIAAKIDSNIRVATAMYGETEFQPGEILLLGVAVNPNDPKYKIYKINSDGTGDWDKWPIDQGAPVGENGSPLLYGDQMIFCVWNDLTSHDVFGTESLEVEVRQTAWVYDRPICLGDVVFVKWQLANKGKVAWDSTYFTFWLDPDIGYRWDDLVGCDSLLRPKFELRRS